VMCSLASPLLLRFNPIIIGLFTHWTQEKSSSFSDIGYLLNSTWTPGADTLDDDAFGI